MRYFVAWLLLCVFGLFGYIMGNDVGYKNGCNDTLFSGKFILSQWTKHTDRHGSIHNTPWNELSIQEKMYLCAYGSSGNKLSKQDLKEITEKYGAK